VDATDLYLSLLKGCLTRSLFLDEQHREVVVTGWHAPIWNAYRRIKNHQDWRIVEPAVEAQVRAEGRDWPESGETMIGDARLDNIQECVTSVLEDDILGDLVEAGVWRGGASILMRAVLAAHGVTDRKVWLADSFSGMPAPSIDEYPADAEMPDLSGVAVLNVSVDQVKSNFARYGLLDDQVRFLVGWFKDTLPSAPIERLALVRLDGDLYESTMDSISALYPKLSVGGYLIVDDYTSWPTCRRAIDDYRGANGITEPIREIDWTGVYWRRER
jgi:O-methyltransferase